MTLRNFASGAYPTTAPTAPTQAGYQESSWVVTSWPWTVNHFVQAFGMLAEVLTPPITGQLWPRRIR